MSAKATATLPAPAAVAPAEPTLADALAAMELACVEDRPLSAGEDRIVAAVMARADRPAAMALAEAGKVLDRAAQGRRARATYAAADVAREQRKAFIDTRDPAFQALPRWLQLEWAKFDLKGGRATAEGRVLARMLEDVTRGEQLATPAAFMPPPPEPGA